jgi:hypothetical protein
MASDFSETEGRLTDSELKVWHPLVGVGLEAGQRPHHRGRELGQRPNVVAPEQKLEVVI